MNKSTGCLLALITLTSGCGAMNQLRGHNIAMAIDAVESIPRTEGSPITLDREQSDALQDALDRLKLAQRDFPKPARSKIERSTPADAQSYNAYAGLIAKREARREAWAQVTGPMKKTWDLIAFALQWSWAVVVLVLVVYIRREFFKRDVVTVKVIEAAVPDKSKRREIAQRTPVEQAFHRVKHLFSPNGNGQPKNCPTDAPGGIKYD